MSETTSTLDSTTSSPAAPSTAEPSSAPAPPSAAADVTPSSGSDSQPSPSSGDSRRSDREELLSAVLKVVPTTPETPAVPTDDTVADQGTEGQAGPDQVAASGTGQGTGPATPGAGQDEPDPSEGELRKLRPETRRRFEKLLAQRNEARQQLAALEPELQQHRQLTGYLRQNQLAADDVNRLLGVGSALRRGDFRAFLDGVTPYVLVAQEALGIRVAPDLQRQVEEGTVSEQAARELTRTRHQARRAEHELSAARQQTVADQQVRNVVAIRDAVDAWEAGQKTRDPDYAHKAVAVRRFSQALLQERGLPSSPQQAVEWVKSAYDEASRELMRMRPAPQPTRVAPSGIQAATTRLAGREPTSMKEAIVLAMQQARRAS